jgi:hypothetical protein
VWCSFVHSTVSSGGEKRSCFFQCGKAWEAFHELGVQDVTEFDFDLYSIFCFLGKKKREKNLKNKKEKWPGFCFLVFGFFYHDWTCLSGSAMWDFCDC